MRSLTKNEYISIHGQKAYDENSVSWKPWAAGAHGNPVIRELLGHGIVGVENLGGDLDKVNGKRFRFYCFPCAGIWEIGSMARCAAEIDEEDLTDAPDRTYKYGGTGYQDSEGSRDSGLAYIHAFLTETNNIQGKPGGKDNGKENHYYRSCNWGMAEKENNPNVPLTPSEIAEDVYECWKSRGSCRPSAYEG